MPDLPDLPERQPAFPDDIAALLGQSRPEALKALDRAGLQGLIKALRAQKTASDEPAAIKALSQALRRVSGEKFARPKSRGNGPAGKPNGKRQAGGADRLARQLQKLEIQSAKLDEKRRKLAEKLRQLEAGGGRRAVLAGEEDDPDQL